MSKVPRRIRLDLATPPEIALRAALAAVEAMPADPRLTEASNHVSSALNLVGRYIDEQICKTELSVKYAELLTIRWGLQTKTRNDPVWTWVYDAPNHPASYATMADADLAAVAAAVENPGRFYQVKALAAQ